MKKLLRKLKREIKPFLIFYLIFDILIIGTFIYAAHNNQHLTGFFKLSGIFGEFFNDLISFGFVKAIFVDFIGFATASLYTLVAFIILFILWKIKFATRYEYQGIEHGSSDWSKNGEEFDKLDDGKEILNKKNGFILSKTHYLGTDLKKVAINKNVLVVGRFWCW